MHPWAKRGHGKAYVDGCDLTPTPRRGVDGPDPLFMYRLHKWSLCLKTYLSCIAADGLQN